MIPVNDFGKTVKHKLIDSGKSASWLCEQVTKRTGLYCDTGYLSKLYRGLANSQRIKKAIEEILEIKNAES